MKAPTCLHIALPVPLPKLFDYRYTGPAPAQGVRVSVPFGHRTLIGIVHGHGTSEHANLKMINEVLDEQPVISADLYQLCERAARYYHHPLGEVLAEALPALLRKGAPARSRTERYWQLTDNGQHVSADQVQRAPRQWQALETLTSHPKGLSAAMLRALDIAPAALRSLEEKGWARCVEDVPRASTPATLLAEPGLTTTNEQQLAIDAILHADGFQAYLLDGITGSGKTEVYLQVMAEVLAKGQQVLVLVPEIGLTPQTLQRFRKRFTVPITTLHSGLSDREKLDNWLAVRDASARIIVGTRSAVFAPLVNPGLIVVDECHDLSFKQQDGFRYQARDLATWRAKHWQCPVILGSATPALETVHLAATDRYHWLKLRQRPSQHMPPQIEILDATAASQAAPLLPQAISALKACVRAGQQALVFINRRGYAPMMLCQDCGWQAECNHCDSFMTWHRAQNLLHCHHCGFRQRLPVRCPSCGSSAIREMGSGTERLEELIAAEIDVPVIRIDRDAVRRKGTMANHLKTIQQGAPVILVGTQMLAKGHHFPGLSLAVILDLDAGFLSPDFRGPEHAAQLLLQVAGRSGRARQGRVLLQSRHPDHALLQLAAAGNYGQFAAMLLQERQAAGLPPFGHLALLRSEAMTLEQALNFLSACSAHPAPDKVHVLGPVPAPMERRAGKYRAMLMLQCAERPALHGYLTQLLELARTLPEGRQCRWHVDVDPVDMT